jgi:hypothetical protein
MLQKKYPELNVYINTGNVLTANFASKALQLTIGTFSAGASIKALQKLECLQQKLQHNTNLSKPIILPFQYYRKLPDLYVAGNAGGSSAAGNFTGNGGKFCCRI